MKRLGSAAAVVGTAFALLCAEPGAATPSVGPFSGGAQVLANAVGSGKPGPGTAAGVRLSKARRGSAASRIVGAPGPGGPENPPGAKELPRPSEIIGNAEFVGVQADSPLVFPIVSVGQSLTRPPASGGTAGPRPEFSSFDITKEINAATPVLRRLVETGQIVKEVRITLANPSQPLTIVLTDVAVSGDTIGIARSRTLEEDLSLTARQYTWSGAGGGSVTYDRAANVTTGTANLPSEFAHYVLSPAPGAPAAVWSAITGFSSKIAGSIDPAAAGAISPGDVTYDPVTVQKPVDSWTTGTVAALTTGLYRPSVKVTFWNYPTAAGATPTAQKILECVLSDPEVTGWKLSSDEQGEVTETLTIGYAGITHLAP